MGQLQSSSSFFLPGSPAKIGEADHEIMDFLKTRVEGDILDLGGGQGAYAHALKELGYQVTLAEKNSQCLEDVRKSGIAVVDMNITSWLDLKKQFDTVILIEVLEHVENPFQFLKNVAACARKKILLTVPCNDDFPELFKWGLTYNHIAVTDHLQQFTTRDIAVLLDDLGCQNSLHKGAHLFPHRMLPLLLESLGRHALGKSALLPVRILNKLGWLTNLFPSRIFAEVYPPAP